MRHVCRKALPIKQLETNKCILAKGLETSAVHSSSRLQEGGAESVRLPQVGAPDPLAVSRHARMVPLHIFATPSLFGASVRSMASKRVPPAIRWTVSSCMVQGSLKGHAPQHLKEGRMNTGERWVDHLLQHDWNVTGEKMCKCHCQNYNL